MVPYLAQRSPDVLNRLLTFSTLNFSSSASSLTAPLVKLTYAVQKKLTYTSQRKLGYLGLNLVKGFLEVVNM